jgi:hypothetical protein
MSYAPSNHHLQLAAVARYRKTEKGKAAAARWDKKRREKLRALRAVARAAAAEPEPADPWAGVDFRPGS